MPDTTPIVVAGGGGRLGSAVLAALRAKWPDRCLVSIDFVVPRRRVAAVAYFEADLGALPRSVAAEIRRLREFDLLWLAAAIGAEPSDAWTIESMIAGNVLAPALFLAAHGHNVRRVVFAGSVEEYGDATDQGVFRESQPLAPTTAYGISKRLAEGFLTIWSRRQRVPCITLRLASLYGPHEPLPKAITDFLRIAASGGQISLLGGGTALRDYAFLTDAAEAFVTAAGWDGEGIFNIAHPERLSLHELALLAVETCGSGSIGFTQSEPALRDRVMDVRRMEAVLGFRCSVDARSGLRIVADTEKLLLRR